VASRLGELAFGLTLVLRLRHAPSATEGDISLKRSRWGHRRLRPRRQCISAEETLGEEPSWRVTSLPTWFLRSSSRPSLRLIPDPDRVGTLLPGCRSFPADSSCSPSSSSISSATGCGTPSTPGRRWPDLRSSPRASTRGSATRAIPDPLPPIERRAEFPISIEGEGTIPVSLSGDPLLFPMQRVTGEGRVRRQSQDRCPRLDRLTRSKIECPLTRRG